MNNIDWTRMATQASMCRPATAPEHRPTHPLATQKHARTHRPQNAPAVVPRRDEGVGRARHPSHDREAVRRAGPHAAGGLRLLTKRQRGRHPIQAPHRRRHPPGWPRGRWRCVGCVVIDAHPMARRTLGQTDPSRTRPALVLCPLTADSAPPSRAGRSRPPAEAAAPTRSRCPRARTRRRSRPAGGTPVVHCGGGGGVGQGRREGRDGCGGEVT